MASTQTMAKKEAAPPVSSSVQDNFGIPTNNLKSSLIKASKSCSRSILFFGRKNPELPLNGFNKSNLVTAMTNDS